MGLLDSVAIIYLLLGLSIVGYIAEFFIYLGTQTIQDSTVYTMFLNSMVPFVDFLRSSYFILVMVLVIANIIAGSQSTLDPLLFGIFMILTFFILWIWNIYVIPSVLGGLLALNLPGTTPDWWNMFLSNWYFAALSGILGSIIGYIKGGIAKGAGLQF